MIEFNTLWQLLLENGASPRKEEGTRRYWLSLNDEQQTLAFNNISRKLAEHGFVHYDPIRAIKENIRTYKMPEPTNYNGRSLKSGVKYVIAKYKGSYGTYTLAEAKKFGMEIKQSLVV